MILPFRLKPIGLNNMTSHVSPIKLLLTALMLSAVIGFVALVYDAPVSRAQEEASSTNEPKISPEDQQLFAIIDRINAIKLDEKIFKDPAFTSLKDISTIIAPQPVGRENPFVPIPGSVAEKPAR